MKNNRLLALFVLIFLLAAAAYAQFPKYLYGIVSFYGEEFNGKKTASGETFDPNAYTAAHRTLPFGTQLEVENLENGKKVRVVVNDRGPFVENRVLDISRQAAVELGIIRKGTVYAKITLIKLGDNKVRDAEAEPLPSYAPIPESTPVPEQIQTPAASNIVQPSGTAAPSRVTPAPVSAVTPAPGTVYKTNEVLVITTNISQIMVTNPVVVTNYVQVPVTNVVQLPPYQDKIVERDVAESPRPTAAKIADDFIIDEPFETPGSAVSSPLPATPAPVIAAPEATPRSALKPTPEAAVELPLSTSAPRPTEKPVVRERPVFSESDITPEALLTNERVLIIDERETNTSRPQPSDVLKPGECYIIQAGAFKSDDRALRLYEELKKQGYAVFTSESVIKRERWIRVRIGYYNTREEAAAVLEKLKERKIQGLVLKAPRPIQK